MNRQNGSHRPLLKLFAGGAVVGVTLSFVAVIPSFAGNVCRMPVPGLVYGSNTSVDLDSVKEAAKEAILSERGDSASYEVVKASDDAIAAIEASECIEEIISKREKGIAAIRAAKAGQKIISEANVDLTIGNVPISSFILGGDLEDSKKAAIKVIDNEQGTDTSENVAREAANARSAIDACLSVEEIIAKREAGVEAIRAAKAANISNNPIHYTMVAGADGVWIIGEEAPLTFTSDAAFAKFKGVKIDNILVDPDSYVAVEGSTKVTFTKAYAKTLKAGKHTIEILSSDGSASASFAVKLSGAPEIGSYSNCSLACILMTASAIIQMIMKKKKKAAI